MPELPQNNSNFWPRILALFKLGSKITQTYTY